MSPCSSVKLPGGITAIVCHGRQRTPRCPFCGAPAATLLCDFKVAGGKTCDAKMCHGCTTPVGPDLDYCPDHRAEKRP
jgi:hypothetical protein